MGAERVTTKAMDSDLEGAPPGHACAVLRPAIGGHDAVIVLHLRILGCVLPPADGQVTSVLTAPGR
ncbi:hypothetical protein GEV904_05345 [Xanthomonas perforans]|nr:hypothetical protein XP4B_06285 [Xanthomonas perforans]KLC80825.1 hypothetical protein GEV904_05345 [Xanthomonas perforans]KLC84706.1 hypothetical protein GEV917_17895 [Xanthomonas perforans]KLC94611.1 hypothetical protein GEV936_03610 [Xanthomonas perforans]KLD04360.1 hypothetical protein GEV993_09980 [Xanthomonas perforans]